VLQGGNEAVEVVAAETATDLEACEPRIHQHELLVVVAIEFGDRFG
jgi:hypothetical protein